MRNNATPTTSRGTRWMVLLVKSMILCVFTFGWFFGGFSPRGSAQTTPPYHNYLPLVSRIEMQSGPGAFTTSYYMKSVDGNAAYKLGCTLGTRDSQLDGSQDNVVILDYGRAIYDTINGQMAYGTRLFITAARVDMNQIAASAERFGEGYYICSNPDNSSHLSIGIGTNNYEYDGCSNCSADFSHGVAFAKMVNAVNDWLVTKGFSGQVNAAGANDIELSWNTYTRTRSWLDGYDSVNQYELYNYGAIEGCPYLAAPGAHCGNYPNHLWSYEEVWYVIWGVKPVYPIPEIYANNGVNAQQWFLMSRYSATAHGLAVEFPGVMTQSQSCGSATDLECQLLNNTPMDGWTQLQNLLNSDPRTAMLIRWVTDIKYQ